MRAVWLALCLTIGVAATGSAETFIPASRAFDIALPDDSPLAFRGALAISPPVSEFGGLSGMVVDGPRRVIAVSDRATWVEMDLTLTKGRLTGVGAVTLSPMLDSGGAPVSGRGWDAEGVTRGAGGQLWVSFEGDHRVQAFDSPSAAAGRERRAQSWEQMGTNSGLEALATAPDGTIWAIQERSGAEGKPFAVFVIAEDGISRKALPRGDGYLPTGADFGPDGRLYITERAFSFIGGFRVRLRRVTWGAAAEPLTDEVLARFEAGSMIDNIESVALWAEEGRIYALLLSDDNFNLLQRNVLALFEVLR